MIETFFPLSLWSEIYFGNTLGAYADAVLIFFLGAVIFSIVARLVIVRLMYLAQRTKNTIDDTMMMIVQSVRPPFYYAIAFFIATKFLTVHPVVTKIITVILAVLIVYQVITVVQVMINDIAQRFSKGEEDEHTKSAARLLGNIAKGIIWALGILMILSNLGINVTSLVAGLGIGGIAIAFALQGILADLFSSFSIYFDKPFKIGDFITTGDFSGTVEKIGVKTTRVRSIDGEEVVISNQELTSGRVQNFENMTERRNKISIGVTYETPAEKLRVIPEMITKIIDDTEGAYPVRVHFMSFDDWALTFEVVYFVQSKVYGDFMNAQQKINFAIHAAFEKEGIAMAYPTQTSYEFEKTVPSE